jgi:CHAD domain-containing protein
MVRSRLPPDLLDRSAQESSRLIALSYLDQIDDAHRRLSDSLDGEALHDFRVGLRRLRSSLRAYRAELKGSVTGKMRRQVRELARSTNAGRDSEVQLSWLRDQSGHLTAEQIPGVFWLVGRLEGRKQELLDPEMLRIVRRYTKVAVKLRRALGVLRIQLEDARGQPPARFGAVTGDLIHEQVIRLRDDLTRIRGASDVEEVHRARIAVKRLRYLLEPVARGNRKAGALIRQLKAAQDLLGEHHDMHVLSAGIASLRDHLPSSAFPEVEQGFSHVAHLADLAATAAFERFNSIWGGESAVRILTRAEDLGRSLKQPPSRVGIEAGVDQEIPMSEPATAAAEPPLPSASREQPQEYRTQNYTAVNREVSTLGR